MYVPRRITSGQLNINQAFYSQKAPHVSPSKVSYRVYIVRVLEKFDHIITRSQHIHVNPHHYLFCDINGITSSVQYTEFLIVTSSSIMEFDNISVKRDRQFPEKTTLNTHHYKGCDMLFSKQIQSKQPSAPPYCHLIIHNGWSSTILV